MTDAEERGRRGSEVGGHAAGARQVKRVDEHVRPHLRSARARRDGDRGGEGRHRAERHELEVDHEAELARELAQRSKPVGDERGVRVVARGQHPTRAERRRRLEQRSVPRDVVLAEREHLDVLDRDARRTDRVERRARGGISDPKRMGETARGGSPEPERDGIEPRLPGELDERGRGELEEAERREPDALPGGLPAGRGRGAHPPSSAGRTGRSSATARAIATVAASVRMPSRPETTGSATPRATSTRLSSWAT